MHQLLSLDGTRVTLNSTSVAGLPRAVRLARLLHCLTWILQSRTRQCSGGTLAMWRLLWQSCLLKIYRGGPLKCTLVRKMSILD